MTETWEFLALAYSVAAWHTTLEATGWMISLKPTQHFLPRRLSALIAISILRRDTHNTLDASRRSLPPPPLCL